MQANLALIWMQFNIIWLWFTKNAITENSVIHIFGCKIVFSSKSRGGSGRKRCNFCVDNMCRYHLALFFVDNSWTKRPLRNCFSWMISLVYCSLILVLKVIQTIVINYNYLVNMVTFYNFPHCNMGIVFAKENDLIGYQGSNAFQFNHGRHAYLPCVVLI